MQYHIEGMDCASCIGKIETALARMPGVSDVQLNFATQSLTLSLLADGATQADDVEKTIKRLGFGISARTTPSNNDTNNQPTVQPWWQTRKGKQVAGLGMLMAAAANTQVP